MKVAIIGAGSVTFTRNLTLDLLHFPRFRGVDLALMDIDAQRLGPVAEWAQAVVRNKGFPARVVPSLDRREAVRGADVVVLTFMVGGRRMLDLDLDLPFKHGVDQAVGDTLGPGGIFRAARNYPVVREALRDIEQLAPGTLVVNYINPLAPTVAVIYRCSSVRVIGLCHGLEYCRMLVAELLGIPDWHDVELHARGVNHQAWISVCRHTGTGEDLYPRLLRAFKEGSHPRFGPEGEARGLGMRAWRDLVNNLGVFMTESNPHNSEYVPYYRKSPAVMAEYATPLQGGESMYHKKRMERFDRLSAEALKDAKPDISGISVEALAPILDSLQGGPERIYGINWRNDRLIPNLPDGCCVEVPTRVSASGFHPIPQAPLPPHLAGFNHWMINVHECLADALLTGSREQLFHALMLDPLTAAVLTPRQMRLLFDEMFEANRPFVDYLK